MTPLFDDAVALLRRAESDLAAELDRVRQAIAILDSDIPGKDVTCFVVPSGVSPGQPPAALAAPDGTTPLSPPGSITEAPNPPAPTVPPKRPTPAATPPPDNRTTPGVQHRRPGRSGRPLPADRVRRRRRTTRYPSDHDPAMDPPRRKPTARPAHRPESPTGPTGRTATQPDRTVTVRSQCGNRDRERANWVRRSQTGRRPTLCVLLRPRVPHRRVLGEPSQRAPRSGETHTSPGRAAARGPRPHRDTDPRQRHTTSPRRRVRSNRRRPRRLIAPERKGAIHDQ